jgi:ABC-type multidrug transport system ATPase subunit
VYGGRHHAVRGISFASAEGQVFGLLGVNGAGKTTTFKMLCGQYVPTAGSIHVSGLDVSQNVHAVRKMIGYCPQFDALLDELTVEEHLLLYARLKGFSGAALTAEVAHQQEVLDLKNFTNSRAGQLSGGNKRKLSVAMATTGEPPMVFLDEPSAGMDPVARRFMWSVIQGIAERRKKSVVILTTHSMEEAEALCSRIAIQVDGLFRCLGSAQQIKTRYGQGLELNVRITNPLQKAATGLADTAIEDQAQAETKQIQERKQAFEQNFTKILQAESSGNGPLLALLEGSGTSLRYQIMPAALEGKFRALGELFKVIQDNQETWQLADFQISQTSLEQIFNRFAASQSSVMDAKAMQSTSAMQSASTTPSPKPEAPNAESTPLKAFEPEPIGKDIESQ